MPARPEFAPLCTLNDNYESLEAPFEAVGPFVSKHTGRRVAQRSSLLRLMRSRSFKSPVRSVV